MGTTKALLVGVCEYLTIKCPSLPMCKNDLFAMRKALVKGLNISPSNIHLSSETGIVTKNDFIASIYTVLKDISENDTFIFYFSGHGGKNCLVLSDGLIELQDLLNTIEQVQTKNKIAIIDSCHSGGFSLENVPTVDIDETVEHFAGRGFAVLVSCGANQSSGFDEDNEISLYTSFVCDALTARFLIRKGKKSLEAINEAIFHFAEVSNRKGKHNFQQPVFRSSIARYKGRAANIVWCYFGYDEDDMVDCNFICHSTWVDDAQDKEYWYRTSKNAITAKGVHIDVHSSYELIKKLKDNTLDKDELIQITRKYTANIISAAEQYIKVFREYINNTITEEELIDSVAPLNIEISKWFLKQSDLPIPPKELHDWAHIHTKLSCTIHDFSLFYDKKNLKTWKSENRKRLLQNAIKQYEMELEELKTADKLI